MSFAERGSGDRYYFYQDLANLASWRILCGKCGCPKWAHAFKSMTPGMVAVGLCACGKCSFYTPQRMSSKRK